MRTPSTTEIQRVSGLDEVGDVIESHFVTIDEAKIDRFVAEHGDRNRMHTSDEYARAQDFRNRVAPGVLCIAQLMGIAYELGLTDGSFFTQMLCDFLAPVYPGDSIALRLMLKEQKVYRRLGKRKVKIAAEIVNQDQVVVQSTEWSGMILC
ncbi:MAG: hypothetical protein A3J07_02510 [Candidatus Doudnabacteria bacterium RIFCSPLOWO2_02_FULL_49_13]|uniref:MaoC-like domain-containing protein n=1 Tax=Candidatus Doudnabacteria bacterium RIFCSPHIGHO2_12_FULL_48_16 TaxID=1817838 RepID=A0A1F5PKV4_9BACT|nr:MAG: hypothetical protein A3B77_03315 [Candidatus Doudnabacteria bacterium RIFCSPHIGHO2_02_FULL_49_24]OGE89151.1 MAG: hypothetical protein A2760_02060 [Candidatus Doudnabacteria bacterium RIFCSPHIGHO2_01_FULL_50_67]OGE90553.1 MAG: hypothetical protein A3E29_02025 [Candidatus Doudnabacteria bacterium RIFCSPHIGHO2_12_FULL_48_16]OGE97177.1 MAG: hypothetical protein A2990_01090 [Candidatus Doudnabacteria bacterium RIFCSPLOWO2_01_FULL_49_40]OGF02945.1 MAG: hypothetical protein A3J07_02510 [Candid